LLAEEAAGDVSGPAQEIAWNVVGAVPFPGLASHRLRFRPHACGESGDRLGESTHLADKQFGVKQRAQK